MAGVTCGRCQKPISGRYITALDRPWHPECFQCGGCGRVIEGRFMDHSGLPYHPDCYHARFSPRCHKCAQPIVGSSVTALGHTWHPEHFVCATCGKAFDGKGFFEKLGSAYCDTCYHEQFSPRCQGCHRPIAGPSILALGHAWHAEHFVCAKCGMPFGGRNFLEKSGQAYCDTCYHELFSPRCRICDSPIRGRFVTNYFQETYCERHQAELEKCFSCGRPICDRLTRGGVRFGDGRLMCNGCRRSAIDSASQGAGLLQSVLRDLREARVDLDPAIVKIRLVDQAEMIRLSTKRHAAKPSGLARTQTWTTNGVETRRELTEILVLHGLPKTHFSAILAHELGHAWLFLRQFPELAPIVEEGFCELLSYTWLGRQNTIEAKFHMHLHEENDDPVYGAGFKLAHAGLKALGWSKLLEYLRMKQKFPSA